MQTVKVDPSRAVGLVLALASLLPGCFAWRYPGLMERHLEVLGSYATKLEALAQDERTVRAQDWGEFTYPLERAREFARLGAARYPERASMRAFQRALDAYGALAADPAILSNPDARSVVAAGVATFRAAADEARADLERERAG